MSRGLVLGKFLPPHQGHVYLVDFARSFAAEVTIVVGSLAAEPIPGALRHAWMSELFPHCRVVHLTDENPQYPHEHPDFWDIWRSSLQQAIGHPVDYLFASEDYGLRLAQELGATFVPTCGLRQLFPVSGTEVRQDPWTHWEALPPVVRPYFVKRISIFGPESTGKTTLAARLAQHFSTVWVPEFARTWLERQQCHAAPPPGEVRPVTLADMPIISRGQVAAEEALARQANRMMFCDTDPAATELWSQRLFGEIPSEVARWARAARYDLTLLLDADVPWVEDSVRYLPGQGRAFLEECQRLLERHQRPYQLLAGSWEERWRQAVQLCLSLSRRE